MTSALQELDNYCETMRERLEAAIHKTTTITHNNNDCPHPPHECAAAELELRLHQITTTSITTGMPWHVTLTEMVRTYEKTLTQLQEEQQ